MTLRLRRGNSFAPVGALKIKRCEYYVHISHVEVEGCFSVFQSSVCICFVGAFFKFRRMIQVSWGARGETSLGNIEPGQYKTQRKARYETGRVVVP